MTDDTSPLGSPADGQATPTVLVVDDEEVVRRVYSKILQMSGFRVLTASQGDEAMAILERERVAVMVTDLVMPEREGLETIVAARRAWPGLRIVAMSGAFEGQLLEAAVALGAHSSLLKPVTHEALVGAVRSVLQPDPTAGAEA